MKFLEDLCSKCMSQLQRFSVSNTKNGRIWRCFEHLGKATRKAAANVEKKTVSIPGQALEIVTNIGTAAVPKKKQNKLMQLT